MADFKFIFILLILSITLTISQYSQNQDHDEDHNDSITTSTFEDHHSHDTNDASRAFGITTVAGLASFIGAFCIFCIKKEQSAIIPCSLSFASGVTIYLSFVHLIPESQQQFYSATQKESDSMYMLEILTLFCVIIGIFITFCIEALFHQKHNSHNHIDSNSADIPSNIATVVTATHIGNKSSSFVKIQYKNVNSDIKTEFSDYESDRELSETEVSTVIDCETTDPCTSIAAVRSSSPSTTIHKPANYSHVSYSVACALILHHFPEGIATFISLYHDLEFGLLVAFALALHDIPSGICISVPIYVTNGSKWKPFLLCFFAAITYPIGAFVGWILIQTFNQMFMDFFIATLFGITGGIMLYISFIELLPTAMIIAKKYSLSDTNKHAKPHRNVYTMSIVSLFGGFLVMAISNIIMSAVSGGHAH